MKFLKIDSNLAFFLNNEGDYIKIDEIGKEDIYYLLDSVTNVDVEFEMDSSEENEIANNAHRIIYNHLYEKFHDLLENRTKFIDEANYAYKEAIEKYCK